MITILELAECRVPVRFSNSKTAEWFDGFLTEELPEGDTADTDNVIFATAGDVKRLKDQLTNDFPPDYLEFNAMTLPICDYLMERDRMIFHGVSFAWRGGAYILTARSGTGKTTQYKNWRRVFRDEVHILNGDEPCLWFRGDGSVWSYPSPWRGKERYGSFESLPLRGIVLLEQAEEDRIIRLTDQEAAVPLFRQIFYSTKTEDCIRDAARLTDRLIRSVPVWKLQNRGTKDSARLTYRTILEYEKGL